MNTLDAPPVGQRTLWVPTDPLLHSVASAHPEEAEQLRQREEEATRLIRESSPTGKLDGLRREAYPVRSERGLLRCRSKELPLLEAANAAASPDPLVRPETRLRELFETACRGAQLREREKQAMLLTTFDGKTQEEAGRIMGTPRTNVARLRRKALAKLKGVLQ